MVWKKIAWIDKEKDECQANKPINFHLARESMSS